MAFTPPPTMCRHLAAAPEEKQSGEVPTNTTSSAAEPHATIRPRTPGQPCAALHTDGNPHEIPSAIDLIGRRCSTVPLAYHIDEHRKLVTITGDYAEPAEWRVLLDRVRSDARLKPGFAFMRDLRYSMHPVDAQTVMGIIAVVRQMWTPLGVRRAAMVTRPGIDVPAAVAHALAEDENMPLRAFTSYDDAVGWLGEERE